MHNENEETGDNRQTDSREAESIPSNFPQQAVRQGEDNERMIQHALERHSTPSVGWFANRHERGLVQDKLMAELAQGFDHRRQALSLVLESRLHSVREACNHILTTGKTQLRQQRLEYFGRVFYQVEQRLNLLADQFLLDLDTRFERIEQYKNKAIRDREQKRMERSLDAFMHTMDSLMDDFRHIVHENVGQGRPPHANHVEAEQADDAELMEQLIGSRQR